MTKLGKYELLEELGRGGCGTVYRARETVLDVERAVKVLHPALISDPEFIERFRREARFAARIEHPHIVPVYELDEVEGAYFLVMKYMPGSSLKELIAGQGWTGESGHHPVPAWTVAAERTAEIMQLRRPFYPFEGFTIRSCRLVFQAGLINPHTEKFAIKSQG